MQEQAAYGDAGELDNSLNLITVTLFCVFPFFCFCDHYLPLISAVKNYVGVVTEETLGAIKTVFLINLFLY